MGGSIFDYFWGTTKFQRLDDLRVSGDLDVTGTITCAVLSPDATTASNKLSHDLEVEDGTDIVAAAGASIFDYCLSTAIFKTSTGKNTIGGDVDVASGKDIVSLGGDAKFDFSAASGAFKTPTGAHTIGGAVTFAANKGIAYTSGTGAADFSNGSGIFKTTTGAVTIGPGEIGLSGNVTISSAKKLTAGLIVNRTLSKTADYTVSDTDPDIVLVGSLGASATITLPTAADNAGRIIRVVVSGDPGAFDVIIEGEGAETINGALNKTNSDQYSVIDVICNGTGWVIVNSIGTWT